MIEQPYVYKRTELVEPDWRRFPGLGGDQRPRMGVGAVAARALREEH